MYFGTISIYQPRLSMKFSAVACRSLPTEWPPSDSRSTERWSCPQPSGRTTRPACPWPPPSPFLRSRRSRRWRDGPCASGSTRPASWRGTEDCPLGTWTSSCAGRRCGMWWTSSSRPSRWMDPETPAPVGIKFIISGSRNILGGCVRW